MKKGWTVLSFAICSTLLMSACSSKEATTTVAAREAISVETVKVKSESLDALSSMSGKLVPYEETDVSFEVSGRIQDLGANIGDKINTGKVLSRLDSKSLQLQVEQANSVVLQAEASIHSSDAAIHSSEANIAAADARINSAKASLSTLDKGAREQEKEQVKLAVDRAKSAYEKLEKDLNRTKALYEQGVVSKKEYDDIQFQVNNAEKDVANAEASYSLILEGATQEQRNQILSGITEAEAGKTIAAAGVEQSVAAKGQAEAAYKQALIGKEQAELSLSKASLTSPLTGVILDKLVSKGEQVNPGQAIYKIGRTDQLKVLLPVPDKEVKDWKAGDQVSVTLYEEVREGKVTKIYPLTNAGTGTVSVEITLQNKKLDWLPGQVVKVNRVTSDNMGILIPIEAVLSSGSNPYVFMEVNGHAKKIAVETGNLVGNKIHITKGLKEGDSIVVRGGELVLDGDPLKTDGGKKQ